MTGSLDFLRDCHSSGEDAFDLPEAVFPQKAQDLMIAGEYYDMI
jgi:hypothetical protein